MSRTLAISVLLSVVTSAVTTFVLFTALQGSEPEAPKAAPEVPESAIGETGHDPAPALAVAEKPGAPKPESLEQLAREVAELRAQLERSPRQVAAPDPEEILRRMAGMEAERQLSIQKGMNALIEIGPHAVMPILRWLREEEDRSYGGGFSTSGTMIRSYPRFRAVLMDALRQIGTDEAKEGLLAYLRQSATFVDFRDMFLLYGRTGGREDP